MTLTAPRHAWHLVAAALVLGAAVPLASAQSTPPASTPSTAPASNPAKDLPNAKDLIRAHKDAIGGVKNIDQLNSIAAKVSLPGPMGDSTVMDLKSDSHGAFNLTQHIAGVEIVVGTDGKLGWMKNPMMGEDYRLLEKADIEQITQQLKLFSYWLVLKPEDNFKEMTTVDQTEFHGTQAYKVKMETKQEGEPEQYWYFGVESKRLLGMQFVQETAMGSATMTFVPDDWQTVENLQLYMKINVEQPGGEVPVTYNEVTLNKVDHSVFAPPEEVKELAAKKDQPESQPATAPSSTPATQPGH
jgi:hypothetical protein